jgi:hypothetical protein
MRALAPHCRPAAPSPTPTPTPLRTRTYAHQAQPAPPSHEMNQEGGSRSRSCPPAAGRGRLGERIEHTLDGAVRAHVLVVGGALARGPPPPYPGHPTALTHVACLPTRLVPFTLVPAPSCQAFKAVRHTQGVRVCVWVCGGGGALARGPPHPSHYARALLTGSTSPSVFASHSRRAWGPPRLSPSCNASFKGTRRPAPRRASPRASSPPAGPSP